MDKVVVITGGSDGLGKGLAEALKIEDAKVIISSNDKQKLETASKELNIDSFVTDVTSYEEQKSLSEYVLSKYQHIDIWINNAGIQIAPSNVENVDREKLHKLFEVNFFGYFYGCQIALSIMKSQNYGTVINIDSTAGLEGKPFLSAYCSSKFAIKGLIESIRKENLENSINVFGIYPGGIQTQIYKEKYPDDFTDYMTVGYVVEKILENLKQDVPEQDLIIRRPKI